MLFKESVGGGQFDHRRTERGNYQGRGMEAKRKKNCGPER